MTLLALVKEAELGRPRPGPKLSRPRAYGGGRARIRTDFHINRLPPRPTD